MKVLKHRDLTVHGDKNGFWVTPSGMDTILFKSTEASEATQWAIDYLDKEANR